MNNTIIFASVTILLFLTYFTSQVIFFIRLNEKLKNADLNEFKKILGEKYQHKTLLNGLYRCKWYKNWITIKANFDETGKLVKKEISLPVFFGVGKKMRLT